MERAHSNSEAADKSNCPKGEAVNKTSSSKETLFENIFRFCGDPMVIIEEDLTVTLVNKEFESLTGYDAAEIENKKIWTDFILGKNSASDISDKTINDNNSKLTSSSAYPGEIVLITKENEHKFVLAKTNLIPDTKKNFDFADRYN